MGFKRPFRTTPIRLGKVYRRRHQRAIRLGFAAQATAFTAVTVAVFAAGMAVTKPELFQLPARAQAEEVSESRRCSWLSVHDGDTIRCGRERVRLADIDAPELPDSPKCKDGRRSYAWCDFDAGYRSRDALRAFLASGPVALDRQGQDKYGRTLAIVSVNGRSAGDYLVGQGLAKPWQ